MTITTAVLTVSDRCSRGVAEDLSGPALKERILADGWQVEDYRIVPDEADALNKVLISWCDERKISLILTTGGT